LRLLARTPAAAVLLALLAVACGGGGNAKSAATTSLPTSAAPTSAAPGSAPQVEMFTVASRSHVQTPVQYPQTPPVGGDHSPVWQNCGFYSRPVVTEAAVHSLEHGAVWITYRPDLPKAQVDTLRALAHSRAYVLVSPWTSGPLPAPVVASAWGLQLKLPSASDPALASFVRTYAGGPQSPEPGAPCTGGFGSPE
jgi:hypothetical protein